MAIPMTKVGRWGELLERSVMNARHTHIAGHSGGGGSSAMASSTPINTDPGRRQMVEMRLRGPIPLKNFGTFLEGDKVYVAVVTPTGAVFLEDSADLFPSDVLMTQLRLLF